MKRGLSLTHIGNAFVFLFEHWRLSLLLLLLVFAAVQMYNYRAEGKMLAQKVQHARADLNAISNDNTRLKYDIEYLKNPHNVLKEVRSQFNYKRPNEHLIVVIPQHSSGTATTSRP